MRETTMRAAFERAKVPAASIGSPLVDRLLRLLGSKHRGYIHDRAAARYHWHRG